MGDRKQPTPRPANQVKPAPPQAPPPKRGLADDGLGVALLNRFIKGVTNGEWKVCALGSARSMSVGPQLAEQIGLKDSDKVILLVAVEK